MNTVLRSCFIRINKMILRSLTFFLILFLQTFHAQHTNFRCNELLHSTSTNPLTFEFRNPRTKERGVVCLAMLNGRESMVMYMEEEVAGEIIKEKEKVSKKVNEIEEYHRHHKHRHHKHRHHTHTHPNHHPHTHHKHHRAHKQAVARAHQSPSSPNLYTGILHVVHNLADKHEDLFDLDGTEFTLNLAPETGLATLTFKSNLSKEEIVYIWQPRDVVNNWTMQVTIPKDCGVNLKTSFRIADPVPRDEPDRSGIVCVLQNSPSSLKFFSLGWRKDGTSAKPRKFVNFGSLRSASTNFVNIYTGKVHALAFPSPCENRQNIQADRLAFRDSLIISAVKSVNSQSFLIYGDLQEVWYDATVPLDTQPKYPLIPINFDSNYSFNFKKIPGLSTIYTD